MHLRWDAERLASHQRDRMRALLNHAREHSPFHARRLREVDPDRFDLAELASLPTMSKADMMAAFDDVVTERRLSLRLAEDHLARSTSEPSLLLDDYVCLASGGSSGLRGVFVQRLEEFADFGASIMRPGAARQMAAGGTLGGTVIAAVMAVSPVHASGFAVSTMTGAVQFVSVPATLPITDAVGRLNAVRPPAIMGYPSKLAQLAREQLAGRSPSRRGRSRQRANSSPRTRGRRSPPRSACLSSISSPRRRAWWVTASREVQRSPSPPTCASSSSSIRRIGL